MSGARAEVAARTDFVQGLVTATEAGQAERTLLKGAEVFDRDQINTAQGARAQLRFSDGGLVSLLPNTTFSVEEYRLGDAGGEDGSLVFGLLRGGLRTVTGAIGKSQPDNYQLKTPVGTLGIRGTEFIAVIDPPGTLRVHVGRGKVVLTNPYGTLEVPEGYNAIMTLTEAPRLTEQGPVYMATGPQGDLRIPEGMVRSDPYNLDLPLFTTLAPASEPFLQSGPGYYMSVQWMDPAAGFPPNSTSGGPGYATFDTGTGALTTFTLGAGFMELGGPGTATAFSQSTDAGLNWGALSNGGITLAYSPHAYSSGDPDPWNRYLPYIIGEMATAPLTGLLSFSLPAGVAPPAYDNAGAIGALTRFDLDIAVASLDYTLNMNLAIGGTSYIVTNGGTNQINPTNPANGLTTSGSRFSFYNGDIDRGGVPCPSCSLNGSGFMTTGGNVGLTYSIQENTYVITGVAPLESTN